MALRIEVDLCTACGDCVPVCPEAAIFIHRLVVDIVADRCNECDGHADEPFCVRFVLSMTALWERFYDSNCAYFS
jgi:Fe-S-cluster-containing hydrogenase component 2